MFFQMIPVQYFFGGSLVSIRREVLDWFHLVENLHKVQMLPSMQKWVEHLLWNSAVESALRFLSPIKQHQSLPSGCVSPTLLILFLLTFLLSNFSAHPFLLTFPKMKSPYSLRLGEGLG
jgi:hypothetical protein